MKFPAYLLLILGAVAAAAARAATLDEALLRDPLALHGGGTVQVADLIGEKPIYLKFWATWCGTCLEQMPHLEAVYREFGDDLDILSVNIWINESEAAIRETVQKFGLSVPIAIDREGALARAFNFFGTPYHVLIDGQGEIVHTGHAADDELDRRIGMLAARAGNQLPPVTLRAGGSGEVDFASRYPGVVALYFTATWCDWYLEDSRPAMSRACADAQRTINRVGEMMPELALRGVASPLWTTDKELREYVDKYEIAHAISIDETNDVFFALKVKTVPTLVVLKDGEELLRTSEFGSAEQVAESIRRAVD